MSAPTDLRHAFRWHGLYAPGDEGASPAAEGASSAADSGNGPDDAAGEDDARDRPRIKQLSDEAAKWRRKYRQSQQRLEQLEAGEQRRTVETKVRSTFNTLAEDAGCTDPNLAWLAAADDITEHALADGKVDQAEVRAILKDLADQHPTLFNSAPNGIALSSGKPLGSRPGQGSDYESLRRKFPAIARLR